MGGHGGLKKINGGKAAVKRHALESGVKQKVRGPPIKKAAPSGRDNRGLVQSNVKPPRKSGRKDAARAVAARVPAAAAATDSGDGDDGDGDGGGEDAAPRPMSIDAGTSSAIKREIAQRRSKVTPTPDDAGVVYLGHIPHGFYEEEMRAFFAQFGAVTRLRLARNKRSGKSKHYAFIEFKHREVGEVVAKAMNNYLMFSKVLVAKLMAPADVHPETFKNADRPFKMADRLAVVRRTQNQARTPKQAAAREKGLVSRERKRRAKLEALGIEYEFGGYRAEAAKPGKRTSGVLSAPAAKAGAAGGKAAAPAPPAKKQKVAEAVEAVERLAKKKCKKEAAEAVAEAPPTKKPKKEKAAGEGAGKAAGAEKGKKGGAAKKK